MSDENKQHRGEPVAWLIKWASDGSFYMFTQDRERSEKLRNDPEFVATPLYTHSDTGEVERLRNELGEAKGEYDRSANKVEELRGIIRSLEQNVLTYSQLSASMRAQLTERDALLQQVWKEADCSRMPDEWHKRIVALALSASAEQKAKDPN